MGKEMRKTILAMLGLMGILLFIYMGFKIYGP